MYLNRLGMFRYLNESSLHQESEYVILILIQKLLIEISVFGTGGRVKLRFDVTHPGQLVFCDLCVLEVFHSQPQPLFSV